LPLAVFPEWHWYVTFAVCLLGGAAAVYSTSLQPWRLRVGLGIAYAALMAVGLLAVHLAVACTSGDCL
jgi:hypothetical protein